MNDMFRKQSGHVAKDLDWCTAKSEMDGVADNEKNQTKSHGKSP